ncbi:hypothetical protein BAUCODRAFT_58822, partial [Baudoinia panamericana UAMH 10762]
NADDPKRPRACESCRGLKVRCDQDPAHPEIPCKRCAKAGRPCVITQPSRKRQKKADSRVAELEKKIDALSAALQQQQHHAPSYNTPTAEMMQAHGSLAQPTPQYGLAAGPDMPSRKRQRLEDAGYPTQEPDGLYNGQPTTSGRTSVNPDDAMGRRFVDIVSAWAPTTNAKQFLYHTTPEEFTDRINALISPEQAAVLFKRYTEELAPHLPAVVFPPTMTADQVFKDKPILYVCILSAAAFGTLNPETTRQLVREAVGAIADCVVRNGAKSLELIQGMQVVALYYKPPERAEQTNFYQIIHMAAVMALDIGLGKRYKPAKARRGFGGPNAHFAPGPGKREPQDSDTLEARRAWLTCYYLCASASMVLRRPNLVRWTNYMRESLDVLESHPDALPSDRLFCQHVKIQHICEEIGLQFLMDDYTANISLTDPKVTYALKVLENDLKTWKENIPPEYRDDPGLRFFEHVTSLYLHEIALHLNHNVEDFRIPFTEESLKSVNSVSDTPLTSNQVAALEACLQSAHGILETMLSYSTTKIKSLPVFLFFVRCVYALVILIKMHVAVCTPGSEMGKMMKPGDLKVEYYIDQLLATFGSAAPSGMGKGHPKVLRILGLLKEWFDQHKKNTEGGANGHPGKARAKIDGGSGSAYQQTPLQMLSQVATTGTQQQQQQQAQQQQHGRPDEAGGDSKDWSFN